MTASPAHVRPEVPSIHHPEPGEFGEFHAGYVARVPRGATLDMLRTQRDEVEALYGPLDDAAAEARYAPGKWSVKELLGHLSDAERVFAYRALRFARADETPLAGFDENAYMPPAEFGGRSVASLLAEWRAVRAATLALVEGLPDAAWTRQGVASGAPASVRALFCIVAGHTAHHLSILRERYGLRAGA